MWSLGHRWGKHAENGPRWGIAITATSHPIPWQSGGSDPGPRSDGGKALENPAPIEPRVRFGEAVDYFMDTPRKKKIQGFAP